MGRAEQINSDYLYQPRLELLISIAGNEDTGSNETGLTRSDTKRNEMQ